jgi:hypothetical protein
LEQRERSELERVEFLRLGRIVGHRLGKGFEGATAGRRRISAPSGSEPTPGTRLRPIRRRSKVLVCPSLQEPRDLGAYTSGTEIEDVAAEFDGKMPTIAIPMRFWRRAAASGLGRAELVSQFEIRRP